MSAPLAASITPKTPPPKLGALMRATLLAATNLAECETRERAALNRQGLDRAVKRNRDASAVRRPPGCRHSKARRNQEPRGWFATQRRVQAAFIPESRYGQHVAFMRMCHEKSGISAASICFRPCRMGTSRRHLCAVTSWALPQPGDRTADKRFRAVSAWPG